jgi:hypothetical protein
MKAEARLLIASLVIWAFTTSAGLVSWFKNITK